VIGQDAIHRVPFSLPCAVIGQDAMNRVPFSLPCAVIGQDAMNRVPTENPRFSSKFLIVSLQALVLQTFSRKQSHWFDFRSINEAYHQFLYACLLVFRQPFANLCGGADQPGLAQFIDICAFFR